MYSVSVTPQFENYQANPAYLLFQKFTDPCIFLNDEVQAQSFAFSQRSINGKQFDWICPPGFHPPILTSLESLDLLQQTFAAQEHLLSVYLLTHSDLTNIELDVRWNSCRSVENFWIDLNQQRDVWVQSQKRDARQRLRKAINSHDVRLRTVAMVPAPFIDHYQRISRIRNFPDHYCFSSEQFNHLSDLNGITILELSSRGEFVAGGIFGTHQQDVDYLFGADNPNFKDAIRLLLFFAFEYFQNAGASRLYLGGGITPGDPLATFKQRMGTKVQTCSTLRIFNQLDQVELLMGHRFNPTWFDGFFPPYIQRDAA